MTRHKFAVILTMAVLFVVIESIAIALLNDNIWQTPAIIVLG